LRTPKLHFGSNRSVWLSHRPDFICLRSHLHQLPHQWINVKSTVASPRSWKNFTLSWPYSMGHPHEWSSLVILINNVRTRRCTRQCRTAGTMTDEEERAMTHIRCYKRRGLLFLWVTGFRAMEIRFVRECRRAMAFADGAIRVSTRS